MSEHTPGPWEVHLRVGEYNSVRVCKPDPAKEQGCYQVAEAEILGIERSIAEANARLIAAAPDLLDALMILVNHDHCGDTIPLSDTRQLAQAAIAKAREERRCALHAAAPDLLAALEDVSIMLRTALKDYAEEPWATRVRAAIAKARGQG